MAATDWCWKLPSISESRRCAPSRWTHPRVSCAGIHFGNGWFGGFTPVIATSIVAATGNRYAGLWFPIGVSLLTVAVGGVLLRETHQNRIWQELDVEADVEAAEA